MTASVPLGFSGNPLPVINNPNFVGGGSSSSSVLSLILRAFRAYTELLKLRPLLTKSVTSAVIAALGNLASQILLRPKKPTTNQQAPEDSTCTNEPHSKEGHQNYSLSGVKLRPVLAFAAYGLCVIGPLTHYFYGSLESLVPWDHSAPFGTMAKRILVERLIFTPLLCAATVASLDLLMNPSSNVDIPRALITRTWPTLLAHWKIWTLPQIINVNFVPVQFRVLFANFVAFFWNIYLAVITQKKVNKND